MRDLAICHHDDAEGFDPFNLDAHAEVLGDPADYFLNLQTHVPIVTRHSDGEPAFVIDDAGKLRPFAAFAAGEIRPHELPVMELTPNKYHFGQGILRAREKATAGARTGFGEMVVQVRPVGAGA